MADSKSQIASFYANRSVFITGATGFIGKALVEKLVRSCGDIKRIYLLIRAKRGRDVEERLADMIRSRIFDRVKSSQPKVLEEKLRAIKGDITMPKFGISSEDLQELGREVSIVFNSAATIRFIEPIDVAVKNNIYSVAQLVEFCNELQQLQALVHLSTAYSNCHKRDTIYEIFYEPPISGENISEAVALLKQVQDQIHVYPNTSQSSRDAASGKAVQDDHSGAPSRSACDPQKFYPRDENHANQQNLVTDLLAEFTQIALRRSNRPNTYTFTKAIAESYLLELLARQPQRYLHKRISVAIVRPSIVGGAWREPEIGYVDNYNGPTGAILSLYTGALQAMPGIPERVADVVPVDMVVNMIVSAGWFLVNEHHSSAAGDGDTGTTQPQQPGRQVQQDRGAYLFNFVSGYRNPLRWGLVTELIAELAYKYPSKHMVRLPQSYFIRAGPLYNLYDTLNHQLPARISDFVRGTLMRQELTNRSSAVVSYMRIRQMTETLTPFTSNQWRISDANVCALYERLDQADREQFHFDVTQIDWPDYIRKYIVGSRLYTLGEEACEVPGARQALRRRQTLSRVSLTILILLFYYLVCHQSRLESALVETVGRLGP